MNALFGTGVLIGDGTAPSGFPAYCRHGDGIRCNFRGCGHTGSLVSPATMNCRGRGCECPCCRFLAGKTVHGCSYGRPASD